MINDLDESLKQLMVTKAGLDQSQVSISFEAPNREWTSHQSRPVVNFYLFDIKENHELRGIDWAITTDNKGIATRKKEPTRLDLSYAVTVWTKEIEDEHSLLGRILVTLMRHQVLPEDILVGTLKNCDYPIHVTTAQPDDALKNVTDFWNAMGNNLKPMLNYTVTLPMDLDIAFTAPLVRTRRLEFQQTGEETAEDWLQIGGTVRKKGKGEAALAGVSVAVKQSGNRATTDEQGNYKLSKIKKGNYIFEVTAPGRAVKEIEVTVPGNTYDIEL
jgi:hypothetical protein